MTTEVKEQVFTVTVDGVEKEVLAQRPTYAQHREAAKIYNAAFQDAVKNKAILRAKLEEYIRDQGVWDDEKQAKVVNIGRSIQDAEKALAKGGISLARAKEIALKLREDRMKLLDAVAEKNVLDEHTAEAQADQEKFNYFVSCCVVYNDTKKPVFADLADFLNNQTKPYAIECANKVAQLMYGIKSDYFETLPERQFLVKYGFMDQQGYLVDKQGRKVNLEGRLINEEGELINEAGQVVDRDGNVIEKEPEFTPFLDDEGNPVLLDEASQDSEQETEEVKAKRGRPKKTE